MSEETNAENVCEFGDYLRDVERDARDEASFDSNAEYCKDVMDRVNKLIGARNTSRLATDNPILKLPEIKKVLAVLSDEHGWDSTSRFQELTLFCSLGEYSPRFVYVMISSSINKYQNHFELGFGMMLDAASEDIVLQEGEYQNDGKLWQWQGKLWQWNGKNEVYILCQPERGRK